MLSELRLRSSAFVTLSRTAATQSRIFFVTLLCLTSSFLRGAKTNMPPPDPGGETPVPRGKKMSPQKYLVREAVFLNLKASCCLPPAPGARRR